jgi:catechol 2,3-dioxygenase-like lactoylglutathione lyase family enzyme
VFFVKDAERSLSFYTGALGFALDWTHQEQGRSCFKYAAQPPFRRGVNRILVRGESVHHFERVIHAGPIRIDRGRRRDEKVMISGANDGIGEEGKPCPIQKG